MTTLTYRGVNHARSNSIATEAVQLRVAQDLIYRGVRHDGISGSTPKAGRAHEMIYRGAPHIVATQSRHAQPWARADTAMVLAE